RHSLRAPRCAPPPIRLDRLPEPQSSSLRHLSRVCLCIQPPRSSRLLPTGGNLLTISKYYDLRDQENQMDAQHIDDEQCRAFRRSAELAGKKWNAAILLALSRGADRFSKIIESVDNLSDRLLAARLRELESHGLVVREVVPTVPVQIFYRL